MESGSQSGDPPERVSHRLADVVGTIIALLTLTVPIVAIAHFSSVSYDNWQPPANLMPQVRE